MGKTDSTLLAIGGGDMADASAIMDEFLKPLGGGKKNIVLMTVATNHPSEAGEKYKKVFSDKGIRSLDIVDVSTREDAFDEGSIKKVNEADALFFTGGDQLNITSLLGGSLLHDAISQRIEKGFVIAGTSAGAAMMSNSMIMGGEGERAPRVSSVEIAPGMGLVPETIIDTHFSQRGRHGRLLTAIAHYPQHVGIGLDEKTGIVVEDGEFRVIGDGVVTVMDASAMRHNDLPYREKDEAVGMFNVIVHVLPAGYRFNLKNREPLAAKLKSLAGGEHDI